MSARGSRLARKAALAAKTDVERRFAVEVGALRRTRDEAREKANAAYQTAVAAAVEDRAKARKDAEVAYDQARFKLLGRLAEEEAEA